MAYFQVNDKCNGCLACVQNCPATALKAEDEGGRRILLHNMTRCARCGTCWRVCPQKAIEFQYLLENSWDHVTTLTLTRCRVCDAPLYTEAFGQTLESKLSRPTEAYCEKHRPSISSLTGAFFPERRKAIKENNK